LPLLKFQPSYILRHDVKYFSHYEKETGNLRVTVRRVTTAIMASYISFKNLLVTLEMNPSCDGR